MEEKIVSVIIPIYNVERYLPQCLDSVCRQTYKALQIILVDDGSTDFSGNICDEYAEKDPRIQVIHQENGGLSNARNVGIEQATGEFVFFLDSDDYLEPEALYFLTEEQINDEADIVFSNFFYLYSSYEAEANSSFAQHIVLQNEQAMKHLVKGEIETFAWGKLIRSDLVKQHLFPIGRLFEDHFWTHYVFACAEKISFVPQALVHYRQRENSISCNFSLKRLDVLDGWADRLSFLERYYPALIGECKKTLAQNYVNTAWLVLTRMKKGKKEAFERMRYFNSFYHLNEFAEGDVKRMINLIDRCPIMYAFFALLRKVFAV